MRLNRLDLAVLTSRSHRSVTGRRLIHLGVDVVDDHGQDELRKITDLEDTGAPGSVVVGEGGLDPVAAWGAAAAVRSATIRSR